MCVISDEKLHKPKPFYKLKAERNTHGGDGILIHGLLIISLVIHRALIDKGDRKSLSLYLVRMISTGTENYALHKIAVLTVLILVS